MQRLDLFFFKNQQNKTDDNLLMTAKNEEVQNVDQLNSIRIQKSSHLLCYNSSHLSLREDVLGQAPSPDVMASLFLPM